MSKLLKLFSASQRDLRGMTPMYKLSYFNITSLGEPIRYLFAYGKIDFEDNRFETEDWGKHKPGTPFGRSPTLEVDGKVVHQSTAICRYLAKQTGLLGESDWDALEADIVVDTFSDYRKFVTAAYLETDETVKAGMIQEVKTVHNPFYFERFEEIVAKNGGHFVNRQLTWADIYFAAIVELPINVLKEPILDKYSNLRALKEMVDHLPGISEYRAIRPVTFI